METNSDAVTLPVLLMLRTRLPTQHTHTTYLY